MTTRFERFSFAINEIYKYWHRIATDVMGKYGLKGSSAVYFAALSRHTEGVTATKLAELCGRNKADVSRVILQMEDKGFIKKERSGNNSYRARVFLTESGKKIADCINECAEKASNLGSFGLSDEQRAVFYTYIELIAGNLKKMSVEGIDLPSLPEV